MLNHQLFFQYCQVLLRSRQYSSFKVNTPAVTPEFTTALKLHQCQIRCYAWKGGMTNMLAIDDNSFHRRQIYNYFSKPCSHKCQMHRSELERQNAVNTFAVPFHYRMHKFIDILKLSAKVFHTLFFFFLTGEVSTAIYTSALTPWRSQTVKLNFKKYDRSTDTENVC